MSKRLYVLLLASLFAVAVPRVSAQLYINEFLALNASSASDPDFGRFADFIELWNASPSPIDLSDYTITDNPSRKEKWALPAVTLAPGAFLVIWADGADARPGDTVRAEYRATPVPAVAAHANFSLSGDGEYIGVFDASGNLVDELTFGVQESDVSRGRAPAAHSTWWYFREATPGGPNASFGAVTLLTAAEARFSLPAGFHPAGSALRITGELPEDVVRFTFDGSTPSESSPAFPDSFPLLRNYVVRARVYRPGMLPSPVVTRSYLVGNPPSLPVVSIATDGAHLYDADLGILRNAIKEREIPISVEYFDSSGTKGFGANAGLRVFGSTIYALPQRPLAVRLRADYGQSELRYPLFRDRANDRFSAFLLRNGGNDYNLTYFRDGLAVQLVRQLAKVDYQAYNPCLVYINGEFHGIQELRERIDANTLASNAYASAASIDQIEDSLIVIAGEGTDFANLYSWLSTADPTVDASYTYLDERIDMHEYMNVMMQKIFIGYALFDLNNTVWRDRVTGRWRWMAADMEHAFGQLGGDAVDANTLAAALGERGDLPEWSTRLFRTLMRNARFRDAFLQRFAVALDGVYRPERTLRLVDSLQALLAPHMPRHIARWNTPVNMQVWEMNIEALRSWLRDRPTQMWRHLSTYAGGADSARLRIHCVGAGRVRLADGAPGDSIVSALLFRAVPVSLEAVPMPGHRFRGWQGVDADSAHAIMRLSGDSSIVAMFEAAEGSIIPANVARDTTLRAADGPWFGVEDVVVHAGATLRFEAGCDVRLYDHVSLYVRGGLRLEGSAGARIRVAPAPGALARRPLGSDAPRWGVIALEDATDSVIVRYTDIAGSGYGTDRARLFATISAFNSTVLLEYSSIADNIQPWYSEGGSAYISHCSLHTENTGDLVNVKRAVAPVVEYCELRGNRAPDTDAIDYDGVVGGSIRHNHIHSFFAENSDGIDLGENARNVIVEHNIIHDCSDKAVSIGQASTALIRRNVIFHCAMGVAVKDSFSIAIVEQNTLHENGVAVACYEKNTSRGGGRAEVRNTILTSSIDATVTSDKLSTLSVRYSLSNLERIPGEGNLHDDPRYVHPGMGNLALRPDSPCIDAGDPDSQPDEDGTRADIGARYSHGAVNPPPLRINEFNYHSSKQYDSGDWIEVQNTLDIPIILDGWVIEHGGREYRFPAGSMLVENDYLLLCEDTSRMRALHPAVRVIVPMGFTLDNASGVINLFTPSRQLAQTLRYTDDWPWPPLADGKGATVELEHDRDGSTEGDWRESYVLGGTPGASNSVAPGIGGLYINELLASNGGSIADENGEFDDYFELYNAGAAPVNIGGLYITDDATRIQRWQVPLDQPAMTTIPPGGFLLLWADEQPSQGALHADFKLGASGESIGVYQRRAEGYVLIEQLVFGEQERDISFGRYPDGGAALSRMSPTPGASNVPNSVDTPLPVIVQVHPNPFGSEFVLRTAQLPQPLSFSMHDALGRLVYERERIAGDMLRVSRGALPPGVYLYRLTDARGTVYNGRIVAR